MEVKIINKSHHPLPGYATPLSAGMDIRANLTDYISHCRKAMRHRCVLVVAWH